MAQETFTKARIRIFEPKTGGAEKELFNQEFPFNPKDYSITRAAKWKESSNKGGLLPATYNGPEAATLTVTMFLDKTDEESGDISQVANKLLNCVNPEHKSKSQDKPSGPHVRFEWGATRAIEFTGYLQSVAVKYALFRSDGTPVRGTATLTMKEFGQPEQGTNPTSGGEPGSRAHRVVAGDTLASIAYEEYGSAAGWRRIADANPAIDDPMRLPPGASLVVPPA